MKITKSQLKRIILEEKEKVMDELGFPAGRGQRELPRGRGYDALVAKLANEIGDLEMGGMSRDEAMMTVLRREDLHNDAMIKGQISAELQDNMVPVPANEGRVYRLNKARLKTLVETIKKELAEAMHSGGHMGRVGNRGMRADILDYMDVFDIAVDPNDRREVMIKLADMGFTFDEDTYLDALDDYLGR